MKIPAQLTTRRGTFAPSSVNEETRTVEVIWTTGARVARSSWVDGTFFEELSLNPKHVRMGRLASGRAPLLANHNGRDLNAVIGVVESARLEKGQGIATVRFAKGDPDADAAWNKVRQGILPNVSVGYRVHKFEKVEGGDEKTPVFRATDWEPYEISAVPMGADADAHFRAEEMNMDPETQSSPTPNNAEQIRAAERERATGITLAVRTAKLDPSFAERLIADGVALDKARALVLEELAKRSDENPTEQHVRIEAGNVGHDSPDHRVRVMAEALASRAGGAKPSDEARQYMRLTTVDMARHLLEARGVSTRLLSPSQIIHRAYATTSDFAALLTETGNRLLQEGYQSYPGGVKVISRESSSKDFRAKAMLRLSEAPQLLKVNEHGEFTRGAMVESKTSYALATFGRTFGLSRQAIINDDLAAFDMARLWGRAAAEFVASQLSSLLISNPAMDYDSVALFHASHGNLAGAGSAISITSLGDALKSLRLQKGLDGKTPINVMPRFLVVPAALETVAKQYVAQINATKATDVNPFSAELQVVVDPRLDASSSTSWYVACEPTHCPTLEHSFLEGQSGPEIFQKEGFEVDGMEWKVRMDFGCGVLDHRGLYKNPGA